MASKIVMGSNSGGVCTMGVQTDIFRPIKWQWMRNGKPVPGAGNAPSYTTPPILQSDDSSYTCIVFGLNGDSEQTDPLSVSTQAVNLPPVVAPVPLPAGHEAAIRQLVLSPDFIAQLKVALK